MLFIVVLLNIAASVLAEDAPIVELPDGKVRGLVATSGRYNTTFYAYLGIPFADKPIGNLRFQPPQPPPKWEGVLEAKSNDKICFQIDKPNINATEDCLTIDVYTPLKPDPNASLPVLVNIPGFAFLYGSAEPGTKMPEYLMEKGGIIMVAFNYRLGAFGFLSTGDTVIPGNMGLKDQNLALQWVQRNIHLFGGDPAKVTIMGHSAGSVGVTYHLLSPKSKGLFRAAIAGSGTALIIWANGAYFVPRAYQIAAAIQPGFSRNGSTTELKNILMNATAESIAKAAADCHVFGPVIEVNHSGAFITESMYATLLHGKFNRVPVLMGFVSEEMLDMAANMEYLKQTALRYDKFPEQLVDYDMNIEDESLIKEIGGLAKEIYVGNGSFVDNLGKVVQYNSDSTFIRAIIRFGEMYSAYEKVYFYKFSYHGKIGDDPLYIPGADRVRHGEELAYFWTFTKTLEGMPAEDIKTLDRFVELLTSFIKVLNPTPAPIDLLQNVTWKLMTPGKLEYLEIDKDLSSKEDPRFSYKPWVNIYEKYAQPPRITY